MEEINDGARNLRLTLKRARRLCEHPRKQYWQKNRRNAQKKYTKLDRRARELSTQLFNMTGEQL